MKEITRMENIIGIYPENAKDLEINKQKQDDTIIQRIKEENKRSEEENKKVKEELEKAKKSMISEEDLKLLLLMFGSRGGTQLLETIIEEKKKQSKFKY
ncbi:MAG: hypothetical protein ACP5QP_04495 [Brevinematia bacterium]